jgi:hypothetical protein
MLDPAGALRKDRKLIHVSHERTTPCLVYVTSLSS